MAQVEKYQREARKQQQAEEGKRKRSKEDKSGSAER